MKRIILWLTLLVSTQLTYADAFKAGKDYLILNSSVAESSIKPQVDEFFSYGCSWCYRIEPTLQKWLARTKEKIVFDRVPVVFHKDWHWYAKAYYVAAALDKSKELDAALFHAINVDKVQLNSSERMGSFLVAHGVDPTMADGALNHSTRIDLELDNAKRLMGQWRIDVVPAFVVAQRYKTNLAMAGSEERLFAILDYLIIKAKN